MRRSRALSSSRSAAALAGMALLLAACGDERPAGDGLPEGTLLLGNTLVLAQILERIEGLAGTPLAARAAELHAALPDCPRIEARAPGGSFSELVAGLRCFDPDGDLAALDRRRGADDLAFAVPLADGSHAFGVAAVGADGGVALGLELPGDAFGDARALLLPGASVPGPGVLSGSEAILHARLRPEGGLDIAALVPEQGQGARLFRLKSELFSGAVLDGTWEAAIYVPAPGEPMPRAALAVGFTLRDLAVAAMENFVRNLEDTWPVRRSDFAIGAARGACLFDLKILPAFEPCYVATDDALVLGWNRASLHKALDGAQATSLGDAGGLVLDLERVSETDARLARNIGPAGPAPRRDYPWRRLRAEGERAGDAVRLRIQLEAKGDS